MTTVAIIGSGLIGQAWAIVFARAGYQVRLWDGSASALPEAVTLIERQMDTLYQHGLLADPDAAKRRVSTVESLEAVVQDVSYVQENLPEQVAVKQDIFAKLDALLDPSVVIASSTSSIPASQFTESLAGRTRCLVAHPVNPPYLIPLVEICATPWTSADVVEATRQIMLDVQQKPVIVHGEPQGFILNRLQGALLREAFRLVEAGHVSVEDLDITIKEGLGLRWSFMGPFETIDLNAPDGLADYCHRYGEMYRQMSELQTDTSPWSPELIAQIHAQRREILPDDALAARRYWRDDALMALMVHKQTK